MGMAISVHGESTEHVEMCMDHLKTRDYGAKQRRR